MENQMENAKPGSVLKRKRSEEGGVGTSMRIGEGVGAFVVPLAKRRTISDDTVESGKRTWISTSTQDAIEEAQRLRESAKEERTRAREAAGSLREAAEHVAEHVAETAKAGAARLVAEARKEAEALRDAARAEAAAICNAARADAERVRADIAQRVQAEEAKLKSMTSWFKIFDLGFGPWINS